MKKYSTHYTPICNCSNSILLAAGDVCEICMGVVATSEHESEADIHQDRFDYAYFEALERWVEYVEYAA